MKQLQLSKRVAADTLVAHAAARRYDKEIAGVTTPDGLLILTGREDQSLVAGAVLYLQNKPAGTTISFTTTAGSVDMTIEQLLPLSLLIGDHVQACRNQQAAITARINAGELFTLAQVDEAFDLGTSN